MFAEAKVKQCVKQEGTAWQLHLTAGWSGSWRNDVNYDGIYLFVKYQTDPAGGYRSAKLTEDAVITGADHETACFTGDNKLGIFVYHAAAQEKTDMHIEDIALTVEMDGEPIDIQVFTLEMVYVPEGAHEIGDPGNGISKGGTLKNCFYTYPANGTYRVESEDAIRFAPEEGCLYCDYDTDNAREENDTFEIPASFPKGYKSMWYMKYSLTEGQYVQFMNCLTRKQQQAHCLSDISGEYIENYYVCTGSIEPIKRCEVFCRRNGNTLRLPVKFYSSAPFRAMNAVSYADVSAFACFAGLRLITELEYEKACRGPLPAVKEEFAWGSTKIGRVFHFDGIDGSGTELPIAQEEGAVCNCNYGTDIAPFEKEFKTVPDNPGWVGPASVGIFENAPEAEGLSERERTGASYYGIMELSGNVWENLVTVGRAQGRAYVPKHGTGELDENGLHTMDTWPDSETAIGIGVRGGVFVSPNPTYVHMALRVFAAHTKNVKGFHGGIRVGY